ncbi:MAG: GAF domain-containing sensor histidine kinase [Deltaproteobacteria bacterium]|nr:GAF domain-containing sensor histidine kinase [Deltaproteobacteria bacterium]
MTDNDQRDPGILAADRRESDRVMRERLGRYKKAFHVGRVIASEMDRDRLFEVVIYQTNEVMESVRSTVFLHDEKADQLWSLVGVGLKKREIRIPSDYGVAGWVFSHRAPVSVNDAYNDPRFYSEVDKKSGFRTRNIMCVPLVNWAGRCIGALQSLNKRSGDFTDDDMELLTFVSNYVTVALENMMVVEELKDLNKAIERAINHLSHELKTPLALIATIFDRLFKDLHERDDPKQSRMIHRGIRNVKRLTELQAKIDDILNLRTFKEKDQIRYMVASAADFVEECGDEMDARHAEALARVLKRIESVYGIEDTHAERTELCELLNVISNEAISAIQERDLEIITDLEKGHVLNADERVLRKVFEGLLKNAIENTPDEGRIEMGLNCTDHEICVYIRDYGVGISPQNQKLIFHGFFHTQDTMNYSSKRPYQFNAGGSGSDLLRTKVFSERFGFSVEFESTRCRFIPNDTDECPGRISTCPFIKTTSDCFSSGGTTFSVGFPVAISQVRDQGAR